jgi:hypothetical protein
MVSYPAKPYEAILNLNTFGRYTIDTFYDDTQSKIAIRSIFYMDGNINIFVDKELHKQSADRCEELFNIHKKQLNIINNRLSFLTNWFKYDRLILILGGFLTGLYDVITHEASRGWDILILLLSPLTGYLIALLVRWIIKRLIIGIIMNRVKPLLG